MALNIIIRTAPERLVRAHQSGDWTYTERTILASVMEDTYPPQSELIIGIHEVIEAFLCRKMGITDAEVVAFDEKYERERAQGQHPEDAEPGDAEDCPYRIPHQAATHVERAACHALDVSWIEHESVVQQSEAGHLKTSSPAPHPIESDLLHPGESLSGDQPSNH